MAVSIDTVYQKVLALANKEQRGYITPQEFNLFADQAQMTIFEQYFYDLNQFKRRPGVETEYNDPIEIINSKLYYFKKEAVLTDGVDLSSMSNFFILSDVYDKDYTDVLKSKVVEEIDHFDYIKTQISPLTRSTLDRPIYYIKNNKIYFTPTAATGTYECYYICKPEKPNWTYVMENGNALFNPDINAGWKDFQLHISEENNLVIKILQLAGVAIKDVGLVQVATQEEVKNIQQEKQ